MGFSIQHPKVLITPTGCQLQDFRQLWILNTLEALLKENAVSSWTISASGKKTAVVLRLASTADPAMAELAHPSTPTQRFRRQPSSQLQRHQRRAAERRSERRRQNVQVSDTSLLTGLFLPTPSPTIIIHHATDGENYTQHSDVDVSTCFPPY